MDQITEQLRSIIAAPIFVMAYATGLFVFAWMARRRKLATQGILLLVQAALIGGLVGANLLQLLVTGLPGKTILGGCIGGYMAVVLMKRRLGITRPTGDLFALALPAGEAIGRLGCFIGSCCYGKITTVAWAVHDHGALRHPTPLYSSLAAALSFALLLWLERTKRLPENGLWYLEGVLLCASRFVIEFFRDGHLITLGMTDAQVACLLGFFYFAWKLHALLTPTSFVLPLLRTNTMPKRLSL